MERFHICKIGVRVSEFSTADSTGVVVARVVTFCTARQLCVLQGVLCVDVLHVLVQLCIDVSGFVLACCTFVYCVLCIAGCAEYRDYSL